MKYTLTIFLLMIFTISLNAQTDSLNPDFKKTSITNLANLINDFYVFPEVGKKTNDHLSEQLKAGYFDSFTTLETFSEALTEEVRSISKDKHMLIRPSRPKEAKENTMEGMFEDHLHHMAYLRKNTGGFKEAKKLEGNVGYFDLRNFAPPGTGAGYADAFMKLLSTSDAIIIDLRENGGGSPDMVQYLCSYFFDEKVHLNSLYFRQGDRTIDFWTLDEVNGEKMPDVPLFVLTSDKTFSGAEEFSYNMQTQKRATLVGETTRGGANPGGMQRINEKLEVFIPTGKAINPITKTNWEGVGVVPEVKTTAEEALTKAHELAKAAAKKYNEKIKAEQKALSAELMEILKSFDPATGEEPLYESLKKCQEEGLVEEGMINNMGYDFLMNHKKPKVAEAIFKANTRLYSESANVYDSYAEALAMNGDLETSVENYKKAIAIAKTTNDPNLELFMDNLKKVKSKMK